MLMEDASKKFIKSDSYFF